CGAKVQRALALAPGTADTAVAPRCPHPAREPRPAEAIPSPTEFVGGTPPLTDTHRQPPGPGPTPHQAPVPAAPALPPAGLAPVAFFPQHQGGQQVAGLVGVPGVAAGEFLDRGALALPERLHELVRDWPERVCGGRVGVAHPQIPSMPPGIPWNTSLSRLR